MARTNKVGLDYFPFDVDFFNDEKIEFTSARFGVKGEVIAIRLLCKIYRNGYYIEWNDDTALLFAKGVGDGCQDSCVKDVVYELLKRGFFDRSIFERFCVLTSHGIQNRYFEATKRYNSVEVFREFLLVDVSKMNNVNINSINVSINPQKKSKIKETITPPPTPAPESGGEECDEKTWKNDFEAYKASLRAAYKALISDKDFIAERERYHPGLNIKLSIEKACKDFWATEAGWKRKKRSKIENIDWKATLRNALDQKCNHVWLQKNETNETGTAQKTVGYV